MVQTLTTDCKLKTFRIGKIKNVITDVTELAEKQLYFITFFTNMQIRKRQQCSQKEICRFFYLLESDFVEIKNHIL